MNIRTICLAILAHGEASGYDLKKSWDEGPFAYLGGASYGSIYPTLAKMEVDGLIRSREEAQAGKPPRRVYSLTERGSEAFVAEMSGKLERDEFRSHFGVIALCAPFLPLDAVSRAIDERLHQQREAVAMLEAAPRPGTSVGWLLDWGLTQYKNEIAFIEANRARLEELAGAGEPGQPTPLCPGYSTRAAE